MNNAVSTAIPPSRLRNYLLHAEVNDIMTDLLDEIENSVQAAREIIEDSHPVEATLHAWSEMNDALRAVQD